jgi:transcriptional regulator with XRE-family HTH domain
MARTRKLTSDAYVMNTLRFHGDLSQEELGKACGMSQAEVSRYEQGKVPVPEEKLRRIAEKVEMDWSLVVHLRRFFEMLLPAAERRQELRVAEPPGLEIFEAARLAVMPYLIEDAEAEAAERTLEEARREAEEI